MIQAGVKGVRHTRGVMKEGVGGVGGRIGRGAGVGATRSEALRGAVSLPPLGLMMML